VSDILHKAGLRKHAQRKPVFSRNKLRSVIGQGVDHVEDVIKYLEPKLIGHKFRDRYIFLEALTHPSCQRDEFTESYQRLEFLGDAVLDMIVASALFADDANLSQGKMTQIKTALVNAQFLAYLAMQLTLT
jgi:dsRNA-specific ribonuclease